MSFPTIRTEYNGALAAFNRHNARLACDYDVRCSAGGHPKSSLIRSAIYEAVAPLSMERFHSAEEMSFPTIRTEYNVVVAAFNRHQKVYVKKFRRKSPNSAQIISHKLFRVSVQM